MLRLTLRTLLAYLDDTLPPAEAKVMGHKLSESKQALELVDQIKKVIRKRSLSTPPTGAEGGPSDPNTVAAYLSDSLPSDQVTEFEKLALESDVHLADVAACHQILTLLLSEQVRVPPTAYRRMYGLVKGPEAIPGRTPGKVIPIGGVADTPIDTADADAHYLLGMSPYSQSQPVSHRAARWVAAALLAVGFVVTAWLAWPKQMPAVATLPPVGEGTKPSAPDVPPEKKPVENANPEKKPEPEKGPVEPEPMPKPPEPNKDLVPAAEPPKVDRLAVGTLESPDDRVLFARKADADVWTRVAKSEAVFGSDKLICPPGYSAKLTFETGAVAELWANVFPDLLPLPLLDTAITSHVAYDGFDADFTLHAGRVYLSVGKANAANVRVRFRDEIWDLTLPDRTSEVVVQVVNVPTPGKTAESPKAIVTAVVLKGTASAKVRFKAIPKIAAGEALEWDSKGGKLAGPKKPDGPAGDPAYFAKSPVYPNAKSAQPMRKVLDQFAERLKEAKSVSAALAENRAEPMAPPTAEYYAGCRFAVLSAAGMGDLAVIADSLNDANRPDVRAAAIFALQHLLACYPDQEEKFRAVAGAKLRLSEENTTELLRTLRGVTDAERTDRDTLSKLVSQLNAAEVAQREAALYTLVTQVDPSAATRPGLTFDTAAPADVREAAMKAWNKRIEELADAPK
jgi:hypothetical protein